MLGAKFPILMPDGFTPFSATGQTSGNTSNGAYISYPGIPVKSLKGAGAKFVAGFTKVNGGKLPDPYTAYAAQAAQVLLGAIAKSNGTRCRRDLEAVQPQGHERHPRQLLDQRERRHDARHGQLRADERSEREVRRPDQPAVQVRSGLGTRTRSRNDVSGGGRQRFPRRDVSHDDGDATRPPRPFPAPGPSGGRASPAVFGALLIAARRRLADRQLRQDARLRPRRTC